MLGLSSQPIIFVIGSGLVELCIRRGRRTECIRIKVDLPDEPREWNAAVRALAVQLRPRLAEHRVSRRSAVVFYESPSSSSQLTSLATTHDKQALAAARLAALGGIGASEDSAVADACELGCDAATNPPRRHLVAAADQSDALRAVADLVESIGLFTEQIIPIDAFAITNIVRPTLSHSGPTQGWLHVGTEQSWLVVVGEGCLRLFRPIRFGIEQLTDVLTRPICINGVRAEHCLTADCAAAILAAHGIPNRDRLLDEDSGLRGQHILPLLQPVLQRVIVELKQSLRFGLSEPQRRELKMLLCGEGASIQGLATILGDAIECRVDCQAAPGASGATPMLLACGCEVSTCEAVAPCCPNLLPSRIIAAQMARRFNRGIWIGLAAGLTLLALDAQRLDGLLGREKSRLAEVSNEMDDAQLLLRQREGALRTVAAWRRLQNTCLAATGFSPDYSAVLREIALATPESIRLVRMESVNSALESIIGDVAQPATLSIEAYAIGTDADEKIASFVERLRASALVQSIALGSTVRSEIDGRAARRFDLRIELRLAESLDGGTLVEVPPEASP